MTDGMKDIHDPVSVEGNPAKARQFLFTAIARRIDAAGTDPAKLDELQEALHANAHRLAVAVQSHVQSKRQMAVAAELKKKQDEEHAKQQADHFADRAERSAGEDAATAEMREIAANLHAAGSDPEKLKAVADEVHAKAKAAAEQEDMEKKLAADHAGEGSPLWMKYHLERLGYMGTDDADVHAKAIADFQAKHSLSLDPLAGAPTREALKAAVAALHPPEHPVL